MEFTCQTYIVDAIMGAGKTSAIINMVNQSDESEKFLIITPYLEEVRRYITSCPRKRFKQPRYFKDEYDHWETKYEDVVRLLKRGENVVTTHAMFHKFTDETVAYCREYGYTLILDEVAEVIEEWQVSEYDYNNIMNTYCMVEPITNRLVWKEEYKGYHGDWDKYKVACDNGSLITYRDRFLVWLFPVTVFNAFEKCFILTYKFEAQLQKYYYDYFNVPYKYLGVTGNSLETYSISEYENTKPLYDYSKLIHILENERMNKIGDNRYALSVSWYEALRPTENGDRISDKAAKRVRLDILKKNMVNFFNNIQKSPSAKNLWTTYSDYEESLKGRNYSKGFVSVNMRATNEHRERVNVAYIVNRFMQPYFVNFFRSANISVNEEEWALTEMLQFIWRSGIRDGKEITVYIPSSRMRNILKNWITEVSAEYNNMEI